MHRRMDKLSHVRMSPKAAYTIMKYVKCVRTEIDMLNKAKMPLLEKYGEIVGDGRYTVRKELVSEFLADYNPLLETEVDIPVDKIKLSDLHGDVVPDELMDLDFLIDFET